MTLSQTAAPRGTHVHGRSSMRAGIDSPLAPVSTGIPAEEDPVRATPGELFSQILAISQGNPEARLPLDWAPLVRNVGANRSSAAPPSTAAANEGPGRVRARTEALRRQARMAADVGSPTRRMAENASLYGGSAGDRPTALRGDASSSDRVHGAARRSAAERSAAERSATSRFDTRMDARSSAVREVSEEVPRESMAVSTREIRPETMPASRTQPTERSTVATSNHQQAPSTKDDLRTDPVRDGGQHAAKQQPTVNPGEEKAIAAGATPGLSDQPSVGRVEQIPGGSPLATHTIQPEAESTIQPELTAFVSRQPAAATHGYGHSRPLSLRAMHDAGTVADSAGEATRGQFGRASGGTEVLRSTGTGDARLASLLEGEPGAADYTMTEEPTPRGASADGSFGFRLQLRDGQQSLMGQPHQAATGNQATAGFEAGGSRGAALAKVSGRELAGAAGQRSDVASATEDTGHPDSMQKGNAELPPADEASQSRGQASQGRAGAWGAPTEIARQALTAGRESRRQELRTRPTAEPAARRQVFATGDSDQEAEQARFARQSASDGRIVPGSSRSPAGIQSLFNRGRFGGAGNSAGPIASTMPHSGTGSGIGASAQVALADVSTAESGALATGSAGRVTTANSNQLEAHLAAKEAFSPASARSILVKLPAALRGEAVNLRFLQRGDTLDIRVASPSAEAAQQLRGELPALLGRLQQAGLQPEAVIDLEASKQPAEALPRRGMEANPPGTQTGRQDTDDPRSFSDEGRQQSDGESASTAHRQNDRRVRSAADSDTLLFSQVFEGETMQAAASDNRSVRGALERNESERIGT